MNAKLNTETPQSFISNGSNTSFSAEDKRWSHMFEQLKAYL